MDGGLLQHQPTAAGDLAGGERRGFLAVFIGAELKIVPVDGDFLAVLRLHFYIGHNVVSIQIGTDEFLDAGGIDVERDGEDEVFIFAAGRGRGLLGRRRQQKRRQQEKGQELGCRGARVSHVERLWINYTVRRGQGIKQRVFDSVAH